MFFSMFERGREEKKAPPFLFPRYSPLYHHHHHLLHPKTTTATTLAVLILGGGPNRIGQGIEFDYCCCHASFSLRDKGFETIMMNSNPETVSTDYDTSSRLYFEPLTGVNLSLWRWMDGWMGGERGRERLAER